MFALFIVVALADPPASKERPEVEIAPASEWPESRRARVPGVEPFRGWPDKEEVPHLVVDCTRRKLTVYVETSLVPDPRGDHWDGWLARAEIRFDLGASEEILVRTDRGEDQLHFRRPKPFLRRLLAYEALEFSFTPFASPPTFTTFRVGDLRAILGDITATCRL